MRKPNLTRQEWASLEAVLQRRADPAKCSEQHRVNLVSLGHHEPPLVETMGMYVIISDAGRAALAARGR